MNQSDDHIETNPSTGADSPYQSPEANRHETEGKEKKSSAGKWIGFAGFLVLVGLVFYFSRSYLNWDYLIAQEKNLVGFRDEHFVLALLIAFAIYVAVTGLSLPGALILTLAYSWYFKFSTSFVLISFASTTGATVAFLTSRYFFQETFQSKFADKLKTFNNAIEKEGNFYLFFLRLVPAFPFFVINAVMGLTKIKVRDFWWVSQLGMLPGTMIYCYAGSLVPSLADLKKGAFTPEQGTQVLIALGLLGTFPLIVKWIMKKLRKPAVEAA